MSFISSVRVIARLAPMLALPFLAASCDDGDGGGGVCGGQLSTNIRLLVDASGDLQAEATAISNTLLDTCDGIIEDLGGTPPAHTGTLDAQVEASCNAASTAITNAKAGGTLTIEYAAPRCFVDAQAQVACEADCTVDASCTPGSVEARCTPGEFSVECSGSCQASAECVATVQQPSVTCAGACEGICEGECSGSTDAGGHCAGTCTGGCRGACTVQPGSASASCNAEFRCQGSCTGTATAPRCETDIMPPSCQLDAQCQAGCEAHASLEVECEPAQVEVTFTGSNQNLVTALENALPKILELRESITYVVASGEALGSAFASVTTSLQGVPACAAVKLQELTAAATAAANASLSVSVSVRVSASVSTSASASN